MRLSFIIYSFKGFLVLFQLGVVPLPFHFTEICSVFMSLGGRVIIVVLKWCYYGARSALCRLCVPSISGVRADFGMDTSHAFPSGYAG